MIEIPIFSEASSNFSQIIEIDNTLVTLKLTYNVRNESWFMDVETDNASIYDIRLVTNFPLLDQYKYKFPELAGDFFVQRVTSNISDDITYDELGLGFGLFYYVQSELESWKEENNL